MKLTQKDAEFLARLRPLLEENDLRVELRDDGLKHFVLRQNYGSHIEGHFSLSRQGVRWRFQRLLNEIYVAAYETILFIESCLGVDLRRHAMTIAKERAEMRHEAEKKGKVDLTAPPSKGDWPW